MDRYLHNICRYVHVPFKKNVYLFLRDREHEWGRYTERGRQRIRNGLQAWCGAWTRELWDHNRGRRGFSTNWASQVPQKFPSVPNCRVVWVLSSLCQAHSPALTNAWRSLAAEMRRGAALAFLSFACWHWRSHYSTHLAWPMHEWPGAFRDFSEYKIQGNKESIGVPWLCSNDWMSNCTSHPDVVG